MIRENSNKKVVICSEMQKRREEGSTEEEEEEEEKARGWPLSSQGEPERKGARSPEVTLPYRLEQSVEGGPDKQFVPSDLISIDWMPVRAKDKPGGSKSWRIENTK